MPSVSLSPELSGYLLQLKETWEHDSLTETAACVFDIFLGLIEKDIPPVTPIVTTKRLRFELRTRHNTFFEKQSHDFGLKMGDVARSILMFVFSRDLPPSLMGASTLGGITTSSSETSLTKASENEAPEDQDSNLGTSIPPIQTEKFDMGASIDQLLSDS